MQITYILSVWIQGMRWMLSSDLCSAPCDDNTGMRNNVDCSSEQCFDSSLLHGRRSSKYIISGTLHACCNKTLAAVRLVLYYIFHKYLVFIYINIYRAQIYPYLTVFWCYQCSHNHNNMNKRKLEILFATKKILRYFEQVFKHISVSQS